MSKLSGVAMELDELSAELGYDGYLDAMADGYDWGTNKDGSAYLYKIDMKGEMEKAHEAWLEERDDILDDLEHLKNIYKEVKPDEDIIERTINFIKKGEV